LDVRTDLFSFGVVEIPAELEHIINRALEKDR
jgi:hypothetical protein